jgi:hypothetical protein
MSKQVAKKDRSQEAVKVAPAGRIQRARKNGPIGSQIDAEGNNNALPKKHPRTNGGNHGVGGLK